MVQIHRDPGPAEGAVPDPRTLIFFVYDTIRADRVSVCGYERPTTPILESLSQDGAQVSCQGISTGSWTVPAHASFFAGLAAWEHKANGYASVAGDCAIDYDGSLMGALDAPTFLGQLQQQGWRTVCLTENRVVSDTFGLTQGCGTWVQTHKWADKHDPDNSTLAFAERALSAPDPRPLLLFVNVMDAHRRLDEVPEGHPWLPRQPPLHYDEDWPALLADPTGPLRTRYEDLYDHGVWKADGKLGRILDLARRHRPEGLRVLATSDHGEMLGEGGFVSHGNGVWDPLVRVPVVAAGFETPLPPGPFSLALLYHLVMGEALEGPPPVAVTTPSEYWADRFPPGWADQIEVVRYEGGTRVSCRDQGCWRQQAPYAVEDSGERVDAPEVVALRQGFPTTLDCASLGDLDARLELLRELGYIE